MKTTEQPMELLTRPEAAYYLRISLRKIDALAATGEIPCSKFGKGKRARVLYRKQDLDRYVLDNLTITSAHTEKLPQTTT